jgi:hypothetical protein
LFGKPPNKISAKHWRKYIAGKEAGTEILMRLSDKSSELVSVFIEERKIFIYFFSSVFLE